MGKNPGNNFNDLDDSKKKKLSSKKCYIILKIIKFKPCFKTFFNILSDWNPLKNSVKQTKV